MKFINVLVLSLLLTGVSCAHHATMRGTVAMKVGENQAHVCLGDGEVKAGDKVTAFYNDCQSRNSEASKYAVYGTPCVKTKLGSGKVLKILNEHYSVIEFDEGIKITEGTFVEKQ